MNITVFSAQSVRIILATMAVLAMVFSPFANVQFASAAPIKLFDASVDPSTIDAGQTETFQFTITNDASSDADIKATKIILPAGFTATNFDVDNAIFGVGLEVDEIRISQNPGGGDDGLAPGTSMVISADITNNSGSGVSSWTVCAYKNNSSPQAGGADFEYVGGGDCAELEIDIVVDPILGCTDPEANNHNPEATEDDDSCTYDPVLTLVKNVNNDDGGTAVSEDWTLSATNGLEVLSGAGGASGSVVAGVYTLSESTGPADYVAGDWSCDAGSLAGDQLTLVDGDEVICSITNTFTSEPIVGCMDQSALNYNPNAEVDSQPTACLYGGSITIDKVVTGDEGANLEFDFTFGGFMSEALLLSANDEVVTYSGLVPGNYTVSEFIDLPQLPANYTLASVTCAIDDVAKEDTNSADNEISFSLAEGEDVVCTFTNNYTAPDPDLGSIAGTKFDADSELGLSGWTIFLDENDNGILDGEENSTVTDTEGNYLFGDLTDGSYTVCEVAQDGYTQISPVPTENNGCHGVSITEGSDSVDIDFTNERNPELLSCVFTSNDYSVSNGQDFTLTWDTNNADSVSIDNGIGSVIADASMMTSVTSDTTYTLTATRGEGEGAESVNCTVSIDVRSGGGGGGGGSRRSSSSSDDEPAGEVLGESISIPEGAPNTGAGGSQPIGGSIPAFYAILSAVASTRKTK